MTHFWSPNKKAYGKRRKRKKEEQSKGMGLWSMVWKFEYGIVRFCTKTTWVL